MQRVLFSCLICLIAVDGVQSHLEMTSKDKSEISSLTPPKISNTLRDVLNQESLVRLSMVQKIQGLVMDTLDNRNNSLTLMEKLRTITRELQSIVANAQEMKEENGQLKQELLTVKEAISHDKNLIMEKIESLNKTEISVLAEKMEDENLKFQQELRILAEVNQKSRQELRILNETNQRIGEENSKLKQELRNLKTMSSYNKRNIQNLNQMNETINKYNDDFGLQLQMINDSLQKHDIQLLDMSGKCMLFYHATNYLHGNYVFVQ